MTNRNQSIARNAAHKLVFHQIDLEVLWREDLYPDFQIWRETVAQFVPMWKIWKSRLEMQKYAVGDYVVAALRCTDPSDHNAELATIHFFGQIVELDYKQPDWALFKTFDGEGSCQRQYKDCIILTSQQADLMLQSSQLVLSNAVTSKDLPGLTCEELGLP